MAIDWQTLFNLAAGLAGFFGAALLKVVWNRVEKLERDGTKFSERVSEVQVLVVGEYAKRDEVNAQYRVLTESIMGRFDRLEQKLDGKADK